MSAYVNWQCPNCGKLHSFFILDDRVCQRCGWSDEAPEDETNRGYN